MVHSAVIVFIIASMSCPFLPPTFARSWRKPWSNSACAVASLAPSSQYLEKILTPAERNTLFPNLRASRIRKACVHLSQHLLEILQAYSTRPDCFQQTVGKIRSRCDETEMSEEDRVRGEEINAPLIPFIWLLT